MTKFKVYQGVTFFQNVIHFHGTSVNVNLLTPLRRAWLSPPQFTQNSHMSNMICADLVG
jgi:hypothetical protein